MSSMSFQRVLREVEINLVADIHLVLLLYLGNGEQEQIRFCWSREIRIKNVFNIYIP